MDAGLELEAEILEKIFKFPRKKIWKIYPESAYQMYIPSGKPRRTHEIDAKMVPWFSRSMEAAWMVVEELTKPGRAPQELYFKMTHAWGEDYGTWAYFDWKGTSDGHPLYGANAPTAAHAICLAALKAVGHVF